MPPVTVIAPGFVRTALLIINVLALPDPQLFDGVTDKLPGLVKFAVKLKLILLVP